MSVSGSGWRLFAVGMALTVGPLAGGEVSARTRRGLAAGEQVSDGEGEGAAARGGSPELGPATLAKLRVLLSEPDDAVVLETIRTLGQSAGPNADAPLVEILAVGTTPRLAVAALESLRRLAKPTSADIVLLYCGHRNVEVRRSAVETLAALKDPRVPEVLMAKLGDADDLVVASAARALAVRRRADAAPRLAKLLEMNVPEVAAALGRVAPASMIPALGDLRGRVGDGDLATALGELLERDDLPDTARVEVVKLLAEVPGPEATTALAEFLGSAPAGKAARPSRAAAQKALDERGKAASP